jgi:hypothetical protein
VPAVVGIETAPQDPISPGVFGYASGRCGGPEAASVA